MRAILIGKDGATQHVLISGSDPRLPVQQHEPRTRCRVDSIQHDRCAPLDVRTFHFVTVTDNRIAIYEERLS